MAIRKTPFSNINRWIGLLVILAILGAATQLVLSSGMGVGRAENRKPGIIGNDRLVSWEPLPEMNGEMCQWVPARANAELGASRQQMPGSAAGSTQSAGDARPTDAAKAEAAKRTPARVIKDPSATYTGIAVDPIRDEVVMVDENLFAIFVYDRRENTPPTAKMSEPKRMIRGEQTFLEFSCSVYVDPANGDIYSANNDTQNWLTVWNRDAKGDVPPTRKLRTPHTTFGIAVDEQEQEMFLAIQDDHAVVVFHKMAKEQEPPIRTLQGSRTLLADPHGMALDPKTGLIFVSNWGSTNERVTPPEGPEKPNWPIAREHNIPSSGKFLPPSITVYPKGAKGDVAPLRVIQGPKTQLNWPTALAVHPDRGELFVANDTGDSVLVFRADASGDVAPLRVLQGSRTLINNPTGVAVDLKNNELWVSNFGNHSATVFKIDAEGNVPPVRVIRSAPIEDPAPMFANPHTVAYDTKREEILVAN